MPRVEVYGQQVRSQALPVTQAPNPPGATGAGILAEGASDLAESLQRVSERKRQQANIARLTDLSTQADQLELDREYGDNGFRKQALGLKAVGSATDYTAQYHQKLEEMGADIQDPDLALRWQGMKSQRIQAFSERANRHEFEQVEDGEKMAMAGAVESARQLVANEPARLPEALKKSGAAIGAYYKARGVEGDALAPIMAEADRVLVQSAYEELSSTDTTTQKRMLAVYGGLMDPGFYRRATDALGESTKRSESIVAADTAWDGNLSRSLAAVDAMVSAGKITAEQGEIARNSVTGRSIDADRVRKDREDAVTRRADELFVNGGYTYAGAVAANPRAVHQADLETGGAWSARALQLEKNLKQGSTVNSLDEVDPATMAKLAAYLQLPEDVQVKAPLLDFADKLPHGEYLQVVQHQAALRSTIERAGFAADAQAFTETKAAIIRHEFTGAGLVGKDGKPKDDAKYSQAMIAIETALGREVQSLKRGEKLPPDAIRKVVQGVLVRGAIGDPTPGRVGQLERGLSMVPLLGRIVPNHQAQVFAFEAGLGDEFHAENPNGPAPYFVGFSGVPADAVKALADAYRAKFGKEPTREQIVRGYQAQQDAGQ